MAYPKGISRPRLSKSNSRNSSVVVLINRMVLWWPKKQTWLSEKGLMGKRDEKNATQRGFERHEAVLPDKAETSTSGRQCFQLGTRGGAFRIMSECRLHSNPIENAPSHSIKKAQRTRKGLRCSRSVQGTVHETSLIRQHHVHAPPYSTADGETVSHATNCTTSARPSTPTARSRNSQRQNRSEVKVRLSPSSQSRIRSCHSPHSRSCCPSKGHNQTLQPCPPNTFPFPPPSSYCLPSYPYPSFNKQNVVPLIPLKRKQPPRPLPRHLHPLLPLPTPQTRAPGKPDDGPQGLGLFRSREIAEDQDQDP